MAITKVKVELMNRELSIMLKEFASRHGMTVGNQRITYNDATCKFTVELGDKSTTGDVNPAYYKECARNGFQFGLSIKQIGTNVKTSKGMMKFLGMRGKFAIVQSADLKCWKYDPVMVATLLKTTP